MNHESAGTDPRELELLSAYLDGELGDEQRGHVERLLTENSELGQLLDELRAQRGELAALPKAALAGDFAAGVLRALEERQALRPADNHANDAAAPGGSWLAARFGRRRNWRIWFWPGVAVAAAVLVSIFDDRPAPRRVGSRAPGEAERAARPAQDLQELGISADRDASRKLVETPALDADRSDAYEWSAAPALQQAAEEGRAKPALADSAADRPRDADVASHHPDHEVSDLAVDAPQRPALAGITAADDAVHADELLIVNCAVRSDAFQQGAVSRLFRSKNFAWESPGEAPASAEASAPRPAPAEPAAQFECVYVEAPASQLAETLAEVQSNRRDFLAVEIVPHATAEDPATWSNYNRAAETAAAAASERQQGTSGSPAAAEAAADPAGGDDRVRRQAVELVRQQELKLIEQINAARANQSSSLGRQTALMPKAQRLEVPPELQSPERLRQFHAGGMRDEVPPQRGGKTEGLPVARPLAAGAKPQPEPALSSGPAGAQQPGQPWQKALFYFRVLEGGPGDEP